MRKPRVERQLSVHAVDAGDVRIADEVGGAVARDETAEPAQRATLHVHAGRGKDDVVRVMCRCVCDFGVERLPFLEELREGLASLRERATGAFDTTPGRVDI